MTLLLDSLIFPPTEKGPGYRNHKEYFILEKDGVPVAGLMAIEDFEDHLELRDPKVRAHIRKSHREYVSGKSRPAEELLAELQKGKYERTKEA